MSQWGKPIVCEGVTFLPHHDTGSNPFAPIGSSGAKIASVVVTDTRCPKCGIPIPFDQIEYVTQVVDDRRVQTGEVVVTVSCHGETWRVSSKRGRIDG